MSGASAQEAFEVSLRGASNIGEDALAAKLLTEVKGLDDRSITNAIKLTRFDVYLAISQLARSSRIKQRFKT